MAFSKAINYSKTLCINLNLVKFSLMVIKTLKIPIACTWIGKLFSSARKGIKYCNTLKDAEGTDFRSHCWLSLYGWITLALCHARMCLICAPAHCHIAIMDSDCGCMHHAADSWSESINTAMHFLHYISDVYTW